MNRCVFGPNRAVRGKGDRCFFYETVMVGVYEKNKIQTMYFKVSCEEIKGEVALALAFTTAVSQRERIIFLSCMHVFCL